LSGRGSSSTFWQFQSCNLYAILTPHCVPFPLPTRAPSPPGPTGPHVVRSLRQRIFRTTICLTIHQGDGCKSHTCYSMALTRDSNVSSVNDALRHAERRRVFNVDGLRRLAAASVDRSPGDILDLRKLAEGGFNRTFLITMRDQFQMVARIPYPVTIPKKLAVASEVATMALLRSSGLPIPEVYGYSASTDNAAETEYIFMQFAQGTSLSDIWFDLGERDIISITHQVAELESKMMSIPFPAGGSLYYSNDLETVAGSPGIPLEDERFCVGPDTRLPLWYGRRAQLDVGRGPCRPLSAFFYYTLKLTDNYRRKCRSCAQTRSR
jgi:Phosphotransferase enzyme family